MINNNSLWFESYKINFVFFKDFSQFVNFQRPGKTLSDFKERMNHAICNVDNKLLFDSDNCFLLSHNAKEAYQSRVKSKSDNVERLPKFFYCKYSKSF